MSKRTTSSWMDARALVLLPVLAIGACGLDPSTVEPTWYCPDGRCDAWDTSNDPARLGRLEYRIGALPTSGRVAQLPWPDDAWRMSSDGIAWRWMGPDVPSPVEKYEMAFGGSGQAVDWERRHHGTLEGEVGEWWGHCNGWAAAALLEPEPLHAAERAGIRFEVSDVKALLSEIYYGADALGVGGRCNAQTLPRDERGRILQRECRDTNAGAFHVVLANLIGTDRRGFVADIEGGYEVFNYVAVGFEVQMTDEVTEPDAAEEVGAEGPDYPLNASAARFVKVLTAVTYMPEHAIRPASEPMLGYADSLTRVAEYEYLLELDGQGRILGGEWLGASRVDHPDFLWLPTGHVGGATEQTDGDNPYISWENVRVLADLSRDPRHTPASPVPRVGYERCDNGMDDDGNGSVDCHDPACRSDGVCASREGGTCAGSASPDAYEPNDAIAGAYRLDAGSDRENQRTPFEAGLHSAGDVDWFAVDVADDTMASLEPTASLTSNDFASGTLEVCAFYVDDGGSLDAECDIGNAVSDGASGLPGCCTTMSTDWRGFAARLLMDADSMMRDDVGTLYLSVQATASGSSPGCGRYTLSYGL